MSLNSQHLEGILILYLAAFMVSFLVVLLLIPPLRKLAFRIDFVDKPKPDIERKIHREPIPLTAGLAIFAGFAVAYAGFIAWRGSGSASLLFASLLILGVGLVDDWYKTRGKELAAWPKLIVQLSAAVIVYKSGIVFYGFNNPFTGQDVLLPVWLQFALTVTWIFGVTTVINFMDGMDGLAGGLSAISAITLFVVALAKGQSDSAMMAIILVGAAVAYLRYNKPPAKVFMGDSGATLFGFLLAVIALDGAFKGATVLSLAIPILALGVPIFDNIFVVLRRLRNGTPIYQADATQAHYRLLRSGLNPKQVVLFLCLINACFSLTSIILLLLNV
ncbi:UDP-N-acetylmuramyl pentapeptide phosphotransferase/UDP-N-acetylglucosamine-1-phosphate transferase [Paenibacillus sp. UNCCL117]|uniref:MraY family glycosyltransferase n=1 Tax=unclassified Paenibacillus TaxID=185978 RepID=UPI00088836FF|nr:MULTISPECIES: MraY family glycosyltransferase [unclassified Paenibacillus]SDD42384.1 UDP-N-acetylmuramyl pentapeptide phosphotransferase/UDP-N-acetylglucosamine-1-phosphate transferase [Paenibacillus sp. cl123]SFW47626.1 UDP-N-acetylmuramyl pentapeptide phosphotransferase/UDP-N-acetylglucosamine-1-phosphate transferase [Paenibacillus sp. UNCCL117]